MLLLEPPQQQISVLDPSDKFRPEKTEEQFRNYTADNAFYDRVQRTYVEMHTNQCVEYVRQRREYWTAFDKIEMDVMTAIDLLNQLVDESDPDIGLPNAVHAYQTAERIREVHPDKDWLHLVGFIHDMGKVMASLGEPQWSVVGDTFPVGCQFSDKIVFGRESFANNPDITHPVYSTKLGIYERNCGLDNITMSWGHDEYLYRVLNNHESCTLPREGLAIIRYHSFYPWHTSGEYMDLCNQKDIQDTLYWVREFNKFDLYSKCEKVPDIDELKPYYQSLVDKYIPGLIKW